MKKTKKEKIRKLIREAILEEQSVEGCQTAADFGGYDSFEAAVDACCAKCSTVVGGDPCYDFCEDRCCELCLPPTNGFPEGFSWNEMTCHCEHDNLSTNPCQVFGMMNIASQESVCNACDNGTPNDYQSNFCGCCPDGQGGTPSSGGVIYPGKGEGGIKAPPISKAKPVRPTKKPTLKQRSKDLGYLK